MLVRSMVREERPVYRLEAHGPSALGLAELLQIVCGFRDVDTAHSLLGRFDGDLATLMQANQDELMAVPGVGVVRAAKLRAALELGRRLVTAPAREVQVVFVADLYNLVSPEMSVMDHEEVWVVVMDTHARVLTIDRLYRGTVDSCATRPAEMFREAVRRNARAVAIVHNHPSGDPTPSPDDVQITRKVVEAGKLLGIDVMDHLIIGRSRYVSLRERGLGFT